MWCTYGNMAARNGLSWQLVTKTYLFHLAAGSATLDAMNAMICGHWLLKTYLARTNFGPFIPPVSCTAPWPEKPERTEPCSWPQRKPLPREPLQRLKVWSMTPSTPWSSMAADGSRAKDMFLLFPFVLIERFGTNHSGSYHRVEMDWIWLIEYDWMPQIVGGSVSVKWVSMFVFIVSLRRDVPKLELT